LEQGIRTFVLDKKRGQLSVTDQFTLKEVKELETSVITPETTRMDGGNAIAESNGVAIRITPGSRTRIREFQRHEYKLHNGKPAHVTRVVLAPAELGASTTLSYTIDAVN
jgi:hypothetical protein